MPNYLSPDYIKVYPAVNSPNDGDINTEYNAKTLAKSSSSRNYILSGFNFISSTNNDTFKLGIDTDDSSIRGSFVIDGYYVEIYKNLEFTLSTDSGAAIVFAIPHYADNTTPDRIKWEKSQHLTGVEGTEFQGIRFECLSAIDLNSDEENPDYDFNPTHYSYTDDPGNTLPSYALMVGLVKYDSETSKYISSLMNIAKWEYSKINAEDVALPDLSDLDGEHDFSSLIPLKVNSDETIYPHTLAEYLKDIDNVYVHKYIDDTKCGKLYFQNTSQEESYNRRSIVYNNNDKLIIDVSKTESRLLDIIGDLTAERVFNAVYNDYAELYEKDDIEEKINPGDVIELNPDTGKYRKCINTQSKLVVGICSDSYGHLIGGDKDKTLEENLKKYIPVGLIGRVYANTDDKTCVPGDLVVSTNDGKVTTIRNKYFASTLGRIIGKCLSKTEDGKVLIQIMLG